jgi:hypothetical protein
MCRLSGDEHAADVGVRLVIYCDESGDQRTLQPIPMFWAIAEGDDDLLDLPFECF